MIHYPTPATTVFLTLFLIGYVGLLLRNAVRDKISAYDFLMHTTVALVPYVFVLFPETTALVTRLSGVEFPFLILFGLLHVLAFIVIYGLVVKINHLNQRLVALTQKVSIDIFVEKKHKYEGQPRESTATGFDASL